MSHSRPKQHARKALVFLSLGAFLAIAPAVGLYFDSDRSRTWIWILLFLGTLPAVGWGASHFARSRGYPTEAGCGISIMAYLVSGFLGTINPHPLVLGGGVLFIVLLPTVVLLSIPNKSPISSRPRR
jgi:hypothetical protein